MQLPLTSHENFFTLSQKIFTAHLWSVCLHDLLFPDLEQMKQRLIIGEKQILLLVEILTWCLYVNTGNTHIYISRIRHSLHFSHYVEPYTLNFCCFCSVQLSKNPQRSDSPCLLKTSKSWKERVLIFPWRGISCNTWVLLTNKNNAWWLLMKTSSVLVWKVRMECGFVWITDSSAVFLQPAALKAVIYYDLVFSLFYSALKTIPHLGWVNSFSLVISKEWWGLFFEQYRYFSIPATSFILKWNNPYCLALRNARSAVADKSWLFL